MSKMELADSSVSQAYDKFSKHYDQWIWQELWRHNERPIVREYLAGAGILPVSLDVGAGTGAYTDLLGYYSKHVLSVDLSMGMIGTLLEKHPGVICVCASASAIPLRSRMCDRILVARVLSHVAKLEEFLSEAARVLLPGGSLIISDLDPEHDYDTINFPNQPREIPETRLVPHKHTLEEIIAVASSFGFSLEQGRRLTFLDLQWSPSEFKISSLDTSGSRHLFYTALFRLQR